MASPVRKKGRGFSDVASEGSTLSVNPTGPTAGRLVPPEFPDEGIENIVVAAKLVGSFPCTTPRKQSNEQVKFPPTTAMSQKEEPRSPRPVRPGNQPYMAPRRRVVSMSDHVAADLPGGVPVDYSTMDFSKVTARETELSTLEQTGWSLEKSPQTGMTDGHPQSTPHNQTYPRRKPTKGRRFPPPSPIPNGVPNGAPKSHPTRDMSCKDPKPTIMAKEYATGALERFPPVLVLESPPPITPLATDSIIPEKTQEDVLITKQEIPVSLSESTEGQWALEIQGTVAPSKEFVTKPETIEAEQPRETEGNFPSSIENFEPYHLAPDERFASESSDESESVTSTICDYEDISQSDSGESDGSLEPVKKRKPRRKRQAIETSDGKVYYPISESQETYIPLSFQIPRRELLRLVSMKEGSKMRVWNHRLYEFEGRKINVEYCTTFEQFETAAQRFLEEKVIGFDMEWLARPSKKVWDNVSLIQMAKEDYIVLFHIARLKKENVDESIPPSLRVILESKDILKTGVHIGGDGGRLKKWLGIEVQGLMELSSIHHLVEYAKERRRGPIPKVLVSLTKLCEQYLQLPIDKGFVRISDWTKHLTQNQISYAATDAYAGFRLFDCLQQARMNISPIPMLPTCVKKNDGEKKKRGVVTPKEGGATPVSTWDTQATYDVALETALSEQTSEVKVWAEEVEESKIEVEVAPPINTSRRTRKSSAGRVPVSVEFAGEKKATQTTRRCQRLPQAPYSPERQFAEKWAQEHFIASEGGRKLASIAQLRAYALWHIREFSVDDTAKHLSISLLSAAQYIRQAIWTNKLDHDEERFQDVWALAPPYRNRGRRAY